MAQFRPEGFDATDIRPLEENEPIPAGDYIVAITESDYVENSKGTGNILKLTFEVLEGEYSGRKVFANLNLNNASQKAVEIAERELSSICHATGKIRVQDSVEFHDIPIGVKVKMRPAQGDYGPQNNIVSYKSLGAQKNTPKKNPTPSQQSAPQTPNPTPPAVTPGNNGRGTAGKKPWQ